MRGVFLGALILFLFVWSASAAPPPKRANASPHLGVQLSRGPQNHLLIPGSINGHPASFLIDTGSDITFLQASRATSFGVREVGREARSGGRWFPVGGINQLRLGDYSLGQTEAALYQPAQFRGPVPGKGGRAADGIIGLDLLLRHHAVINCRTQQLFLQSDTAPPLDLSSVRRSLGFSPIPIAEDSRGALTVPCSIGPKNGRLAVDTGAFVTIFDEPAVRDLHFEQNPSKLTARTPSGKVRRLTLGRINDPRIGGVAIAPQKFALMDFLGPKKPVRAYTGINRIEYYDMRVARAKQDILGLLGSELLYQHSAVIDLNKMLLFLK